jgi:hypothetical protein
MQIIIICNNRKTFFGMGGPALPFSLLYDPWGGAALEAAVRIIDLARSFRKNGPNQCLVRIKVSLLNIDDGINRRPFRTTDLP